LAQHISRKELKKDEVRDTLAHGAEALLSHQTPTIVLVAVVIVAAACVYGWRMYSQAQAVHAESSFTSAMDIFQAPVGPPQAPGQLTYANEDKKYSDAEQAFSKVSQHYGRTRAGQMAAYYAALCNEKLGNNSLAEKWLQGLVDSKDIEVASMAKFELAGLDARSGKTDQAIALYKQVLAQASILVPKPEVMLALANCYSTKDPSQAAKLYGQIKADYPDTPIADQADEALALLPANSKS
jgi:predicted negative regulator of RcsB-dependent stress response